MAWIILIVSGILEAVWATALGKSEGFTKLWPTIIFGVALIASMGGLAFAMRDISVGTAYARLGRNRRQPHGRLRDGLRRRIDLGYQDPAHPRPRRLRRRPQNGRRPLALAQAEGTR
jgi:hypothetical protein